MTLQGDRDGHTPPGGVPLPIVGEPDSGRLGRALHGELVAANPGGMGSGDEVLDRLAEKLAPKLNGHNGEGPKHKFLGLEVGAWTKMLVAYAIGAVVAIVVWQLTIRDELGKRPTIPQVEESSKAGFEKHNDSAKAHPSIQERLDEVSTEQKTIRESQIQQVTTDKAQTKLLEKLDRKIDRRNRRDR
jgi:hypothetical protein